MIKYPFFIQSQQKKKGFSIIELIFTIVIIALVLGIGGLVVSNILNSWHLVTTKKKLLFNGRVALNRMVREIRHIVLIHECTEERLEFDANVPYRASPVRISYSEAGADNALRRRENNGTNFDLAHHLRTLRLSYFDANHDDIFSDCNRTRTIEIELEFEDPDFETSLKLRSSASIRRIQNN